MALWRPHFQARTGRLLIHQPLCCVRRVLVHVVVGHVGTCDSTSSARSWNISATSPMLRSSFMIAACLSVTSAHASDTSSASSNQMRHSSLLLSLLDPLPSVSPRTHTLRHEAAGANAIEFTITMKKSDAQRKTCRASSRRGLSRGGRASWCACAADCRRATRRRAPSCPARARARLQNSLQCCRALCRRALCRR